MNTFLWKKTHRAGGGLFVGLHWHYATRVAPDKTFKLVGNKFIKQPGHYVWHLDIGLGVGKLSIYIRKNIYE